MTRKQPLTFKEFKSIYSKVPRLCVDLLITSDEGFLFTLRQKNGYIGQWHIPGGTVLYREKVKDAIQRVAKEELGTGVIVGELIDYLEYFSEEKERGFGYTITLVFLCRLPEKFKLNLDNQVKKYGFFKVPPTNTIREQKDLISKLISQKNYRSH
jgi:ADP-ribose pyrophosphatase YjhB (NUDIX family)